MRSCLFVARQRDWPKSQKHAHLVRVHSLAQTRPTRNTVLLLAILGLERIALILCGWCCETSHPGRNHLGLYRYESPEELCVGRSKKSSATLVPVRYMELILRKNLCGKTVSIVILIKHGRTTALSPKLNKRNDRFFTIFLQMLQVRLDEVTKIHLNSLYPFSHDPLASRTERGPFPASAEFESCNE